MAAPQPKPRRTPLGRAPRPELGHAPIPKERYTSAEFARLERERLWSRVWQMAGFERDLAEPGDYFSFETGPESVLVVRQEDGGIRAFHNVCMHRGNRLREPGRGRARFFECGYHAWRYDLDGRLRKAPQMAGIEHFDREAMSLVPLRVEAWGPWAFIHRTPSAASWRSKAGTGTTTPRWWE